MGDDNKNITNVQSDNINPTTTKVAPKRGGNLQKGAIAGSGSSFEEFLIGFTSGVVFGLVSPSIGHPFDSVKTRMQADPTYHNFNFRQTVYHIYKTDGIIGGFYRGFIPPLIGSMAFRGLQFSVYAGSYSAFEEYCVPALGYSEAIPYTGGLRPSVLVGAFMASFARAAIESPLDYIKVRKMVGKDALHDTLNSTSLGKSSLLSDIKEFAVLPMQTIRQLYRGFTPTLLRTFGLLGSFFVMVDYSVRYIPDVINAPGYGPFFKGGICATTAWVFAFPFETAKSVIQADTTGRYNNMPNATFKVLREVYRERGIMNGIYRGFGPGAGRSFIANGISMTVFAKVQDLIRNNL